MCLRGANLEERLVLASLYIYIPSFGPQKFQKQEIPPTTAAKSNSCYQFLNKSPELKARPKTPASLHVIGK